MKKLTLILIIILFNFSLKSQIIPSTCVGVDSALNLYKETAAFRAYNYYSAISHDYFIDSIPIYDSMKNKYLDVIMAIYNTTGFERDSIFVYHKIKSFLPTFLNQIRIKCDTSLDWGKNLASMNLVTGYQTLDSMLVRYHIDTILSTNILGNYRYIQMQSDSFYNTIALAQHFNGVIGITVAGPMHHYGDGDDVYDSIGTNFIDIAFSNGWGINCSMGRCENRKFWRYRVYDDCSVEYLGNISMASTQIFDYINEVNLSSATLFPNPVNTELQIQFTGATNQTYKIFIYSISGQVIDEKTIVPLSNDKITIGTGDIESGMYFIKIVDKKNHLIENTKFIKM